MVDTYIDESGYKREHSNLIHRKKAYKEIYLKNRNLYPLPFRKYVIHHIDENKLNNKLSNLQIVTPDEHDKIHGRGKYANLSEDEYINIGVGEFSDVGDSKSSAGVVWSFLIIAFLITVALSSVFFNSDDSSITGATIGVEDSESTQKNNVREPNSEDKCFYTCVKKCEAKGLGYDGHTRDYKNFKVLSNGQCGCTCGDGSYYYWNMIE